MDGSLLRALLVSLVLHAMTAAAWSGGPADRAPVPLDVDAAAFSLEWTAEGTSGVSEAPADPVPERAEAPPSEPEPVEILTREEPGPDEPVVEPAPDPAEPDVAERQADPVPEPAPALSEAPIAAGASASFPVPAADNPAPRYPEKARIKGIEGRVMVRVFVTPDGSVDRTEVIASSGNDLLDAAAKRAVERWRFHPATLDGHPSPGEIDVPIQFVLKE